MDLFGRKAQNALKFSQLTVAQLQHKLREQAQAARQAREECIELQIEIARLEERLKPFQQTGSPKRLYKTEEEEEAEFAYEQGHIDLTEYERVLKKAGFENADVELAPEVSDIVY